MQTEKLEQNESRIIKSACAQYYPTTNINNKIAVQNGHQIITPNNQQCNKMDRDKEKELLKPTLKCKPTASDTMSTVFV